MGSTWFKRSLMAVLPVALLAAFTVVPTGVSSAQTATPWALTGSMNYAHATAQVALNPELVDHGVDNSGGAEVLPNGLVFVTGDSSWKGGTAEVFNPATGNWTMTAPMLYPVRGFAMTELLDGRILVTGGYRTDIGVYTNRTQIWSPSTGRWTESAPSPAAVQPYTTPTYGEEAITLHNGQALLLSNSEGLTFTEGGSNVDATSYRYNPTTDTWSNAGSRPDATLPTTPAVVLPNGNVLVVQVGGPTRTTCAIGYHGIAELYQPATNTWKLLGPVPGAWDPQGSATLLNDGTVLYAGGSYLSQDCTGYTADAFIYSPAIDTWTQVGSMSEPRFDMSAVKLADGRVLIAGGDAQLPVGAAAPGCHPNQYVPQSTWRVDIYNPATRSFTPEPTMLQPRQSAVSALLPNGKVLVAGGLDYANGGPSDPPSCTVHHDLNEAELFTP